VAPIWSAGDKQQDALLASCYDTVLAVADQYQISTIAFPAIGTGAYGWPSDVAARIAVDRVTRHLAKCALPHAITFCCFTPSDVSAYKQLLAST
jgi:O-acetyl-ADP-ribose deacetylase (regulator of RNase III)